MEIKTPDLGVDSAEVSEIFVSVGDNINKDDDILLLESDKAAVEVPSSASGKISKIHVEVGDTVSEGSVLIEVEENSSSTAEESDNNENGQNQQSSSDVEGKDDSESKDNDEAKEKNANKEKLESNKINNENEQSSETKTYSLPDLGVDEAEVAEVMVSVGDTVEAEQSILLIESDKASVEVPSPASGKIEELLISAGDTVANGQDFVVIAGTKGSSTSPKDSTDKSDESEKSSNEEVDNNSTNSNQETVVSNAKSKKNSESSKNYKTQQKLNESEVNKKLTNVYAGPAVRKLARQLGVDITQINGSALNNRIVKEDVFSYVKSHMTETNGSTKKQSSLQQGSGLPELPDMTKQELWGEIETQDLSRLQKVSIPQLNYNTYLPQVTQFDLSDITATEKLRKELKPEFKAEGIGLTILAFIVKATAYALIQYPKFNSHLSDDNTQIHVRKIVNMGIAVATDDGLIVPVIRDAQTKGIKQIAKEIGELATKARDKKLSAKELQGASFSISSQGNLGGTYFTPLVNWPQVGILGASEASIQPRWNDEKEKFEPRLMLPLSLSYDHRVINGADAAVFTRYIAKLLADPRRILI